jgi:Tol biopolymer transport system component
VSSKSLLTIHRAALAMSVTLLFSGCTPAPIMRSTDQSPRRIAFHSDRDGDFEIYVMNEDSSIPTRLTFNDWFDGEPAWSPDGNKIAFVSQRDGDAEIYLMNADGTGQIRLTHDLAHDGNPVWQP